MLEVPIEKGDMFSHVFGRDPRGYVRGVGLGPSPASLGIDGHRKCTSTTVQMANRRSAKIEDQNKLLINCLGVLFDEVRDLREKVDGGQGQQVDDVVKRVSSHTPEHGSNPTPAMVLFENHYSCYIFNIVQWLTNFLKCVFRLEELLMSIVIKISVRMPSIVLMLKWYDFMIV